MNLSLLINVLLSAPLLAPSIIDGKDPKYWANASVILGDVVEIENASAHMMIKVKPIATFTGALDPAASPILKVSVYVRWGQSVVLNKPSKGQRMIMLLERENDSYRIPDARVTFMPGDLPMAGGSSLDLPGVPEFIERLRKLRASNPQEEGPAK